MDYEKLQKITIPWMGLGLLSLIVILALGQPWTARMGPGSSPTRVAMLYILSVFLLVPAALYCISGFMQRDEWYAPLGTYVPGSSNQRFGPRTVTTIAVLAAVFAALGVFSVAGLDLAALVAAFGAVTFGPHVIWISILVGSIIRFFIGGFGFLVPIAVPHFAVQDATMWAIASYVFWNLFRTQRFENANIKRLALFGTIVFFLAFHLTHLSFATFMKNPWEAFLGWLVGGVPTFWGSSVIGIIAGSLAGYALWNQYATDQRLAAVGVTGTESEQSAGSEAASDD